ncbi:MAG: four helix bundle protein [Thermodesulfobacteriota bacterium]
MEDNKKTIISFQDLEIYQITYKAMLLVCKSILPKLSKPEQIVLKEQLRSSVDAIPRMIVEGYSRRHQNKEFLKYFEDALTKSNDTIVSLRQAIDLYPTFIDASLCKELLDTYNKASGLLEKMALNVQTDFLDAISASAVTGRTFHEQIDIAERQIIADTLNNVNWNIEKAVELLKLSRASLYNKIKKHNIHDDFE